jgi:zinc transport system substrate-binding protein
MVKKIISVLLCISVALTASACGSQKNITPNGKVKITVSFNALKEFVAAVGGDKVDISVIIPDGTEPHEFEPKAQDLIALNNADIFVINGLSMERWAADAVKASGNTALITVDASTGIDPIVNKNEAEVSEHGQYDPHIWLSLKCAEIMVLNIKDALVKADPDNSSSYQNNYTQYAAELEQLCTSYSAKFAAVSNKSFVTGHAAFGYLCRDFNLEQNSVEDVFAEGEPTAQQLSLLIEYCKENHVTTIFSEALENPDVADTLAKEAGAQVKSIFTIESSENGKTYLERMEENLKVIYESMV